MVHMKTQNRAVLRDLSGQTERVTDKNDAFTWVSHDEEMDKKNLGFPVMTEEKKDTLVSFPII